MWSYNSLIPLFVLNGAVSHLPVSMNTQKCFETVHCVWKMIRKSSLSQFSRAAFFPFMLTFENQKRQLWISKLNFLPIFDFNAKLLLLLLIYPVVFQLAHNKEWGFHNARVNCVAWSPNSQQVASGSLDTTIIIWSVLFPAKHVIIKSKLILSLGPSSE